MLRFWFKPETYVVIYSIIQHNDIIVTGYTYKIICDSEIKCRIRFRKWSIANLDCKDTIIERIYKYKKD